MRADLPELLLEHGVAIAAGWARSLADEAADVARRFLATIVRNHQASGRTCKKYNVLPGRSAPRSMARAPIASE